MPSISLAPTLAIIDGERFDKTQSDDESSIIMNNTTACDLDVRIRTI